MDDVSQGVAMFSTTGNIDGITAEAVQTTLDGPILDGSEVEGNGSTSIYLTVDKYHQFVSTLTRLNPSPDQVVGVADLRLCDGDKWRESVKVCFELFSTAAASERVAGGTVCRETTAVLDTSSSTSRKQRYIIYTIMDLL